MPFLFLFGFVFLEIYLLVQVAYTYGLPHLLFFLILKAILGFRLVRVQGVDALLGQPQRFEPDLMERVALVLGGILLILPGFITDVLALILIFPWTRKVAILMVAQKITRRMTKGRVFYQNRPMKDVNSYES